MNSRSLRVCLAMLIVVCAAGIRPAPSLGDDPPATVTLDVPFEPTPPQVVAKMLEITRVTNKDYVFDLGCGDGRIVIMAAKKYGARGYGCDLDPQRVRESIDNAKHAGVTELTTFTKEDIRNVDLRPATVVTMYLLNSVNLMIRPKLFQDLSAGTRCVTHAFHMDDWEADAIAHHPRARGRILHYWVIPARVGGTWSWTTSAGALRVANTMTLEQEFQAIDGKITFDGNPFHVGEATAISGKKVTIDVTATVKGQQVRVLYKGTAEGDKITGTQEWQGGPAKGSYPWTATRTSLDLAGRWTMSMPDQKDLNGTLVVTSKDGRLFGSYVKDSDERETPVPAFYVWGASIRCELPGGGGQPLILTGNLEGNTGKGTLMRQGWPNARAWTAKRESASTKKK